MPAWLAARRADLARLLGRHYAAVVDVADRAATAFLLAFGAKLAGDAAGLGGLFHASLLQAAALAGLVAAGSVVKSVLMLRVTGSPALLSPASRTLRATRDRSGLRPQHTIPVRAPRRPRPTPRGHHAA